MHQVYFSKELSAEMMFQLLCSVLKKWRKLITLSWNAAGSVGMDIHPLDIITTMLVTLIQFRWVNQWKYIVRVLGLFLKQNSHFYYLHSKKYLKKTSDLKIYLSFSFHVFWTCTVGLLRKFRFCVKCKGFNLF